MVDTCWLAGDQLVHGLRRKAPPNLRQRGRSSGSIRCAVAERPYALDHQLVRLVYAHLINHAGRTLVK